MGTGLNRQRGVSLEGFAVVVFVIIILAITAMKIVPAYTQNKTIRTKFIEVAHDPELRNARISEIQSAFSKRAAVSEITNLKAEDIEISRDDGGITLSANYSVKIPLVANASLLLEFSTSSADK